MVLLFWDPIQIYVHCDSSRLNALTSALCVIFFIFYFPVWMMCLPQAPPLSYQSSSESVVEISSDEQEPLDEWRCIRAKQDAAYQQSLLAY